MISSFFKKIFGSQNEREVKKYFQKIKKINDLEPHYQPLNDEDLKAEFAKLIERHKAGESLDSLLNESFAITREASKRVLGMRHFDVQLIGGMVLHEGRIAEMKTGEGKTLVATLPVVLNAIAKKGVHVVTVNDYLAARDAADMGRLYNFLGFTVGTVVSGTYDHTRKDAYRADITYGTNNEFGFDYLRDNMKYSLDDVAQLQHNFAIVDEVDSILIDEARTPLIISGPTNRKMEHYFKANQVALALEKDVDFTVDEKNRVILTNDSAIAKAEEMFGVDNLYSIENAQLAHLLDQALKANFLFAKDVDYVVKDGQVVIVDEFTGRLSEGRRYSEGLHQSLEAKEGVVVQEETQTLADITFQNYFRLYSKLAGMTGTAQTEATEFAQIYNLDVISIPTNVPVQRKDLNDLIFKSENEKFHAVINHIKELNKKGQPVLVGTASIERSEALSTLLKKEKIPHTVLNAKAHDKEAMIIADAGKKGAVTIATNMAGRGVDIKISEEIKELGGLAILGTERHESRRIDNQLRGRSGRQGDPGFSRFYLSLEDSLIRIFQGDKIKSIMERLGVEEGEHIESGLVTRAVENAQKKVENLHFESRKHLLEYDDVANEQRKTIYRFRRDLLEISYDIDAKLHAIREEYIDGLLLEANIIEGIPSEDFEKERLIATLKEDMQLDLSSGIANFSDIGEIKNHINEALIAKYETNFNVVAADRKAEITKVLYLQILDKDWREHLYSMDIMKTGIGLRGYNQKDPLVEYKKESYGLFVELVGRIKLDAVKTIHNVVLTPTASEEALKEALEKEEEELLSHATLGSEIAKPVEKKLQRNELCHCGSGKKYKYCHGMSGPKKGALSPS